MICFTRRSKISSAIESGQDLPDDLAAHLEVCPSCRRFFERQRDLVNRLRIPVSDSAQYPAGLTAAIMRAIQQPEATRTSRPGERRRISPWLAPLSFASVALAAALFLIFREPVSNPPAVADLERPISAEVVAEETAPADYIRSWSVAINQPLDTELDSVVADARSAVRFLAVNFLPDSENTESL
ncbi:MAG: hypothetical protein R3F07_20515 [Opitutaceae bacterium]